MIVHMLKKLSQVFALQMATFAKACTQENPQLRPTMRLEVVVLTALSSTEDDWDIGSFCKAHSSVSLVSVR
ncbi:hypothetical protein BT93_D0958 [Corymbia citriodora subsp. variegata]|nr:hypothetical protein BT93_D0958 [Corymbia citriodora subsp. variegata]